MNTRDNVLDQPLSFPPTTAGHAVDEALRRFSSAPTVSNKVAAITALRAYFAEIERTTNDLAPGST